MENKNILFGYDKILINFQKINQIQSKFFFSTFFAMYLLNCSNVISLFPNPATLFITSCIYYGPRLNFICSDITVRSSNVSVRFCSGSMSPNMAFRPLSLKGFPLNKVNFYDFVTQHG